MIENFIKNDKQLISILFTRINDFENFIKFQNFEISNNSVNFNIIFDKNKLHNLFKKEISYSDINDKDFYILPIFIKITRFFIFHNYFCN